MESEAYDHEAQTLEVHPSYNRESKVMVPEIIEIGEEEEEENEECKGVSKQNNNNDNQDVYVAVGKDDLQVLRWVLANVVAPGARVNLIHIYPPISSISTPVGRLWVGQLSPEQAKVYAIEEHNKRKNLLQKYIHLCLDSKVDVDTILIESIETTKTILDLIPILNITSLVMGTKRPPTSRRMIKGLSKGALIQKNAPIYCKVSLVYTGKKYVNSHGMINHVSSFFITSNDKQSYERKYMECTCFPIKFY